MAEHTELIMHKNELSRRVFLGGAFSLGLASLASPGLAFAVTSAEKQAEADEVRNQLVGLQADLEEASEAYYAALDECDAAQAAMEAAQKQIDETSAEIASIQDSLSQRARAMYRSGSSGFLDVLMGSTSFAEFTQNWELLNQINDSDAALVDKAKELREQLEETKAEYEKQKAIAEEKAEEAQTIKDKAQALVDNAETLVAKLDAEAQKLLEEEQEAAARKAAEEAAAKKAAEEAAAAAAAAASQSSGGSSTASVGDYSDVVSYALSRIGCPYVWGATGPNAFDCSGLVYWCYKQAGRTLGARTTEGMYSIAAARVSVSSARPGDVLYRYGHVGIAQGYGGDPFIHAPRTGRNVTNTDSLSALGFTCALQFS